MRTKILESFCGSDKALFELLKTGPKSSNHGYKIGSFATTVLKAGEKDKFFSSYIQALQRNQDGYAVTVGKLVLSLKTTLPTYQSGLSTENQVLCQKIDELFEGALGGKKKADREEKKSHKPEKEKDEVASVGGGMRAVSARKEASTVELGKFPDASFTLERFAKLMKDQQALKGLLESVEAHVKLQTAKRFAAQLDDEGEDEGDGFELVGDDEELALANEGQTELEALLKNCKKEIERQAKAGTKKDKIVVNPCEILFKMRVCMPEQICHESQLAKLCQDLAAVALSVSA